MKNEVILLSRARLAGFGGPRSMKFGNFSAANPAFERMGTIFSFITMRRVEMRQ